MSNYLSTETKNEFKRRFNAIVKSCGISNKQLADSSSLKINDIKNIKAMDKDMPNATDFMLLKSALGCSVKDLLGDIPDKYEDKFKYYVYAHGGVDQFCHTTGITDYNLRKIINSGFPVDDKYKSNLLMVLSEDEYYSLSNKKPFVIREAINPRIVENFNVACSTYCFMNKRGYTNEYMAKKLSITTEVFEKMLDGMNIRSYSDKICKILQIPVDNIVKDKYNISTDNLVGYTIISMIYGLGINGVIFSKNIGLEYTKFRSIINKGSDPSLVELQAIAKGLSVDPEQLAANFNIVSSSDNNTIDDTIIDNNIITNFKNWAMITGVKLIDLINEDKRLNGEFHLNTLLNASKFDSTDREKQIKYISNITKLSVSDLKKNPKDLKFDLNLFKDFRVFIQYKCTLDNVSLNDIGETVGTPWRSIKYYLTNNICNTENEYMKNLISLLNISDEEIEYFHLNDGKVLDEKMSETIKAGKASKKSELVEPEFVVKEVVKEEKIMEEAVVKEVEEEINTDHIVEEFEKFLVLFEDLPNDTQDTLIKIMNWIKDPKDIDLNNIPKECFNNSKLSKYKKINFLMKLVGLDN